MTLSTLSALPAVPGTLPIDPAKGALPFAASTMAETVDAAILSRRSLRAFKTDPVPRAVVEQILSVASRAPSGSNIQPWQVRVLTGTALERLKRVLLDQVKAHGVDSMKRAYNYYPVKWYEPYLARRRKLGWSLYGTLGIGRDDKDKMAAQHARNFAFFDAPIGIVFTIDRDLEIGSWLDYGMFIQSVMLAARARGLDTCAQAALADAHEILRRELAIPEAQSVVCGMSMGYARTDAIENGLVTEREPIDGFTRFEGF